LVTQVVVLLVMAFGIAAGVEELYKFLIVKYCSMGGVLTNPHAILTYLVR
jgi:hypothetical protein